MSTNYHQFEQRKQDHIELALMPSNQAQELNMLDNIHLIHEALPDFNFADIYLSSSRFGKMVPTPFIVGSMTAGHKDAVSINRNLITACAESGWAMGIGSQRRQLSDDKFATKEWQSLRNDYPDVSLFSNIGIAQLITSTIDQIKKLTESINAEAIIVHCNPLQECIQPEGTPQFKGSWHALESLVKNLKLPVIVKETGCGFSLSTLKRLNSIGIAAVDVSGLGGTHWGRIEGHRAKNDSLRHKAASTFRNWGEDTVKSVKNAIMLKPKYEVWGSGGVRHGLDAAKLLALGVSTVSFAKPMLDVALKNAAAVLNLMQSIEYELKVAMFCTGSQFIKDLREKACL